MYHSTLGYSPNPLILRYQEEFLEKLRELWKRYIDIHIPEDEFLLFPDIHGLLLTSVRPDNPLAWEYRTILRWQYDIYRETQNLIHDHEKIPWTNIVLTLDFYNPDIEIPNHPDHKKNNVQVTFGNKTPEEWRSLFAQSFDIVRRVSPWFMNEIEQIIRKIIPFDVSYGVHNSGSYFDFIGHLVMSYPTSLDNPELALLEAILHEYNHNKLNLILQTKTLILNDRREIYYSPYRPDARHIHGIYLWLHALVGAYWVIWNTHVSGIITLSENWIKKAVLYVLKNWLSLQILDQYALLSPLGREYLEEMRAVHRECLLFIKQANINSKILAQAKEWLTRHFYEVKQKYPEIRY